MDPVSSLNQIALLLRQQLLEKAKGRSPAQPTKPGTERPSPFHTANLEADTLEAMRALQNASPDGEAQALRRLVNLALRQELGPELENDAGFQRVIDSVVDAMREDPQFIASLRRTR
jgi:hypothetical protein